jgi:hypothetical protein
MTVETQLEDFDEWLQGKYEETLCDWRGARVYDEAETPTERAYYELLRKISIESKWVAGRKR